MTTQTANIPLNQGIYLSPFNESLNGGRVDSSKKQDVYENYIITANQEFKKKMTN